MPNMIELCDDWFGMNEFRRAVSMLHEMGHYSDGGHLSEPPNDQKAGFCSGRGDRCYRAVERPFSLHDRFSKDSEDSDPRLLVEAFEENGGHQRLWRMLGNIDNYVSYMWNRFSSRGTCVLA